MNVMFPPVDESYIKAKIEDGFYSNATELVRDAVRRLREHDDQKYNHLMAALEVGEQAVREGRIRPYSPQVFEEIKRDARQHAAEGRKPNPDVCP
jgi:antitoxin ParD1/3/4